MAQLKQGTLTAKMRTGSKGDIDVKIKANCTIAQIEALIRSLMDITGQAVAETKAKKDGD